jgi:hypothetical protein
MVNKIITWGILTAFCVVLGVFVNRHTDLITSATAMAKATTASAGVSVGGQGKASAEDQLSSARTAYAHGDQKRAIKLFKAYSDSHPKNADVRGELGNVYYTSGHLSEAADAYYDAATLLLDQNQISRASALIPIIAEGKPALASELGGKLDKAMVIDRTTSSFGGDLPQRPQQSALTRY